MKEIENARSVMVDYEVYRNRKMVAEEIAGNSWRPVRTRRHFTDKWHSW